MRKRITSKVDINAIGIELQEKETKRRRIFAELANYIRINNNIDIREARRELKANLTWKCVKYNMQTI